jgi:hypothetical protein
LSFHASVLCSLTKKQKASVIEIERFSTKINQKTHHFDMHLLSY